MDFRTIYRHGKRYRKYDNSSDEKLILIYKRTGDVETVGILFERYSHLVYGTCLKYLKHTTRAEDATMEILEGLFGNLLSHEIKNFPGWLYRVSQNHCLMALREKQFILTPDYKIINHKEAGLFMESELDLHQYETKESLLRAIEEGLQQLSREQERCLTLFYLKNRSYQEISDTTGFDLKQIKSHIQNGKRNLKNYLIKNGKATT